MYQPKNCPTLDKVQEPQIRLGIQGFSGTGKTTAALTFPNPVVLNIDRGLGFHFGRKDVIEVPIWNKEFCRTINPAFGSNMTVTLKDVIEAWLTTEAKKLEEDQTLIIDGISGLQNSYHAWYAMNPVVTKQGKVDDFGEWRIKLVYFGKIFEEICKTLKCNVIVCAHESEKKDKSGDYTGKIRPLLRGQFQDELVGHFTDWFRALSKTKDADKMTPEKLSMWKMTSAEYTDMCASFPNNTIYYWQTESDDVFDGKTSTLANCPRFIPASYQAFKKHMKIRFSPA